jgi:hypothetical protein
MSLLDDVFLDRRDPAPQLAGPRAGTVIGTQGSKLLVSLEAFPDQQFACSWGHAGPHNHTDPDGATGYSGGTTPPAGTRCLVLFAGNGLADPWVVAFASWPA